MSPFPHSSPDSHHPSQSGDSFSEAFLDTASVRDALPEQYRAHFDELRSSILAFCKEFGIPVETLRSKEDFGKQLTSKKIPAERMSQAVLLFAQLEHLVIHGEPLKEEKDSIESIEQHYHLREQYAFQYHLLKEVGILNERNAIVGIDDHEYPVPTLEQIASRLFEQEKELSIKRDQGFTKLLFVPFGMSLDALRKIFEQFLLSYQRAHLSFDLKIDRPLWTWDDYMEGDTGDDPKLMYNPQRFNEVHYQARTKSWILGDQATNPSSFPGWRVHLLQPSDPTDPDSKGFAHIPKEGQGEINGQESPRPDIEANKTLKEYFFLLQEAKDNPNSPYFHESGLTPEDWMLACMVDLEETGQPLDNYQNGTERGSYLLGVLFTASTYKPCACWSDMQASLYGGGLVDNDQTEDIGARFSVVI